MATICPARRRPIVESFVDPVPDPDWNDRAQQIDYRVDIERPYVGSLGLDESRVRRLATQEVDRAGGLGAGLTNHFIAAQGDDEDLRSGIARIGVPTLVLHGTDDPMFPLPARRGAGARDPRRGARPGARAWATRSHRRRRGTWSFPGSSTTPGEGSPARVGAVGVIDTAGLTKRYPRVTALDSLDVSVGEGVTGLVGANGAGKSTLIKILLGLVPATSGTAQRARPRRGHRRARRSARSSATCPSTTACPPTCPPATSSCTWARCRGCPTRPPASARPTYSATSGWPRSATGRSAATPPA